MKGLNIALLASACLLFPIHIRADTPNEFIDGIVDELAERMQGRRSELEDDPEALYALVDEVLLSRFDQRKAAQQVLARHWKDASEDQRKRFIEAFSTTLLHRYAHFILDFEHDQVKVYTFRGKTERKSIVIKTTVDLVDGSNVFVYYTLIPRESSWRIINFKIESFSFVGHYREQFGLEISDTGLEQFIARLEDEAASRGDE